MLMIKPILESPESLALFYDMLQLDDVLPCFEYILQSPETTAQNLEARHTQILLAYYDVPGLDPSIQQQLIALMVEHITIPALATVQAFFEHISRKGPDTDDSAACSDPHQTKGLFLLVKGQTALSYLITHQVSIAYVQFV